MYVPKLRTLRQWLLFSYNTLTITYGERQEADGFDMKPWYPSNISHTAI